LTFFAHLHPRSFLDSRAYEKVRRRIRGPNQKGLYARSANRGDEARHVLRPQHRDRLLPSRVGLGSSRTTSNIRISFYPRSWTRCADPNNGDNTSKSPPIEASCSFREPIRRPA